MSESAQDTEAVRRKFYELADLRRKAAEAARHWRVAVEYSGVLTGETLAAFDEAMLRFAAASQQNTEEK